MIGVVLVDDQTLVRAGFRVLIESSPDITVLGEAANGRQAVEVVAATAPDIVLMDVRMPEMDGLEATRQILAEAEPDCTRVVILTTFELDEYVYEALRSGASGFLLKDVPPEYLLDAIRTVAAGNALLAPSITRRLIAQFVERAPARSGDRTLLGTLTPREREVLVAVAQGWSNAEVADGLHMSPATAKTHVSRLLTKLGARDRAQLVVTAYESGLMDQH